MKLLRCFLSLTAIVLSVACSSVQAEDLTPQQIIADDAAHGGFKWTPWTEAPAIIKSYILKRDHHIYENIMDLSNSAKTAVAVQDLDFDKKNDVVIWLHAPDYCGTHGCRFYVLPGDARKKTLAFNAFRVKPIRRGVIADDNVANNF